MMQLSSKMFSFAKKITLMKIVQVFATVLLIAGMALLIFACLAVMQVINVNMIKGGWIAPAVLGGIFFFGGLALMRNLVR